MQTKRLIRIPGMALTAMLTLLVVPVLVYGDDARRGADPIVGTWRLEAVGILPVDPPPQSSDECDINAQPGPPGQPDFLPVFKDLRTSYRH